MKTIILAILLLGSWMLVPGAFAGEKFINPEGAMQALKTADEDTREDAAKFLGDIRYEKATKDLSAAMDDASDDVREEAARALGKIGAKDAVDVLISHLGEGSSSVRAASAEALAHIGDPKALDPMRKQLVNEGNPINQIRLRNAIKQLQATAPGK